MRPQSFVRVCKWLLIAGIVLLHISSPWWMERCLPRGEYGFAAVVEAMPPAQIGLLTTLAVLGPGHWLVRLLLSNMGIIFLLWRTDAAENSNDVQFWLLTNELVALAIVLLTLRGRGIKITQDPWPTMLAVAPLSFRWSIRSLIVLTAIGAIFVKVGMMVHSWLERQAFTPPWLLGCVLGFSATAMALLCLWTCLRPADALYRLICIAPVGGVLAVMMGFALTEQNREPFLALMALLGYQSMALVGTFLLVRTLGYRVLSHEERLQRQLSPCLVIGVHAEIPICETCERVFSSTP